MNSKSSPKRPNILVQVLMALSGSQLDLFQEYLQFKPFNSNPRLLELFNLVRARLLETGEFSTKLSELAPFSSIPSSQINKQATLLHQKLDQFLAMEQINAAPHRSIPFVLKAYQSLFPGSEITEKKYRQLHKRLNAEVQTTEHIHAALELEHFAILSRLAGQHSKQQSAFRSTHELADRYTVTTKLKYLCASFNEARVLNLSPPVQEWTSFETILSNLKEKLGPLGLAYFKVLNLLMVPKPLARNFKETLDFIADKHPQIPKEDRADLYHYVLNVCYQKINANDEDIANLTQSIYDQMIVQGLLTLTGKIHPRTFKSIVSLNSRLGNFSWALEFVDSYRKWLPEEDIEFLPQYCKGSIYFYKKDFKASARIFRQIVLSAPEGLFWGFESRTLLLKSLYSSYHALNFDELEELHRLVNSFRMYIRRNSKLSTYYQKCYLNFIYFFTILLRHLESPESEVPDWKKLEKEIENTDFITYKEWLLKALAEKF